MSRLPVLPLPYPPISLLHVWVFSVDRNQSVSHAQDREAGQESLSLSSLSLFQENFHRLYTCRVNKHSCNVCTRLSLIWRPNSLSPRSMRIDACMQACPQIPVYVQLVSVSIEISRVRDRDDERDLFGSRAKGPRLPLSLSFSSLGRHAPLRGGRSSGQTY